MPFLLLHLLSRFVEKDGKKSHPILNPADGYPFDNNRLSVSIISDKSINCDALSTSAFALGLEDGKKLIEGIDNVEAVFVTKDKKVYLTKGFKDENCDALSTSAFALGLEDGKKLIEGIDNVEAVFVTKDKKVYLTKGFKDEFEILNNQFKVVK